MTKIFSTIATIGFDWFLLSKATWYLDKIEQSQSLDLSKDIAAILGIALLVLPIIYHADLCVSLRKNSRDCDIQLNILYKYLDDDEEVEKDNETKESKKLK